MEDYSNLPYRNGANRRTSTSSPMYSPKQRQHHASGPAGEKEDPNAPWEKHFREDYKYHASICQHDDPYDCDDDECC